MTDNEIIKAKGYVVSEEFVKELEEKYLHYRANSEIHVGGGVCFVEEWQNVAIVTKYILDQIKDSPTVDAALINHQKAEIERLKHFVDANEMLKAEAVKEFAERLKATMEDFARMDFNGSTYYCVGLRHIDNLVKEFTEERGIKHEEASGTAASGDDAAKEGGS